MSTSARNEQHPARPLQALATRGLALFALLFAMPAVSNAVLQVLEVALGADTCSDRDCHGDDGACPESCVHCTCCVHANVLPGASASLPHAAAARAVELAAHSDELNVSDFHATLFRPPVG